jgi:conflict system STAND superfamily ATPase
MPIQLNDLNLGSSTADDANATLEEFTNKRLITLREDTAEIAHEVLVYTWQRLVSWIDQDRERLRLHSEPASAASVWEKNGQDPAFLYYGSRLTAVLENLNKTDSTVPPSVQSFLDSSRSHERRRTRKLCGLRKLVGLLATVVFKIDNLVDGPVVGRSARGGEQLTYRFGGFRRVAVG